MWTVIKLLHSLSVSFPALAELLRDIASALQSVQAASRRRVKDAAVDDNISAVLRKRMRDAQLRIRKDADGKKLFPSRSGSSPVMVRKSPKNHQCFRAGVRGRIGFP